MSQSAKLLKKPCSSSLETSIAIVVVITVALALATGDVVCSNPGQSANVESTDVELTTCACSIWNKCSTETYLKGRPFSGNN